MSKSAQAKILFLISVFTENTSDWIDVFSAPLPRLSGFPKRDKTIKQAIADLLAKNMLEYKKEGERILIRPTKAAYLELASTFPLYRSFITKWDKRFRLVLYHVPENKRAARDSLRRILQLNHLGQWQSSLWVSPYPLDSLLTKLKSLNLDQFLQVLEANLYLGKEETFADKIWHIGELNKNYQDLYRNLEAVVKKPRGKRRMIEVFRESFLKYQKLLILDPGLPEDLLPVKWYGLKVRKALKKLQKLI